MTFELASRGTRGAATGRHLMTSVTNEIDFHHDPFSCTRLSEARAFISRSQIAAAIG
jgi:hypothetical protein